MHIWLIYPYGGIPGEGLRPERPEMLAEVLIAAGHHVTWWVSGFNHRIKQHRAVEPTTITVTERYVIRIVPTTAYKRNISFRRIRSEMGYATGMLKWAQDTHSPDVVIISEPSLFYQKAALETINRTGAALVLDTLDLWPEMFHIVLPSFLQPYGRQIFAPLYARRTKTFLRAHGLLAVSNDYADYARRLAPQVPSHFIQSVYFGVNLKDFRTTMQSHGALPPELTIPRAPKEIRLIFASTLGSNYDVETVLAAAELLMRDSAQFRLYIAGTGPLEPLVASRVGRAAFNQMYFLGIPDANTMARIYAHCDIGISAYVAGSRVTMPIKAFHYCAAGLAVVNSLDGEFKRLLSSSGAGVQYHPGDSLSLANAIMQYATNPKLLSSARAASHQLGNAFDTVIQYPKVVPLVEQIATQNMRDSAHNSVV